MDQITFITTEHEPNQQEPRTVLDSVIDKWLLETVIEKKDLSTHQPKKVPTP